MFQTVDAAQLKALLEGDDPPRVVDVRTAGEFARGTIAGAQHLELGTLAANVDALDPGAPVVMICQSGARSAQACAWMDQRGFQRVYSLGGGIAGWMRAGMPVAK
ncbi:MAG: rhodanese-like domain-containing protein [Pseudomonadota bacterium]|nr:rhodanese-like domain-containing protein [Pseudomonadota bacterium]